MIGEAQAGGKPGQVSLAIGELLEGGARTQANAVARDGVSGGGAGVASFAGIYLSSAAHGPAAGLATTTDAIAATLLVTAACARVAVKASSAQLARARPGVDTEITA